MRPERIEASDENSRGTRSADSRGDGVDIAHGRLEHAQDEIEALRRRVEELEIERAEIRTQLEGILQALDALRSA